MSAAIDDVTVEQNAWRDLLDSPGWTRLVDRVRAEWDGPAFVRQVEQLADNPSDPIALAKLRQLLAAKRAVMTLVGMPAEQLAKAKRVAVDPYMSDSRRGAL